MKTKLPAQSVIFNSGFLISLSFSVFAVFLLALGDSPWPTRLDSAVRSRTRLLN